MDGWARFRRNRLALLGLVLVVVLALTLLQLWLSKKWVHYEQA